MVNVAVNPAPVAVTQYVPVFVPSVKTIAITPLTLVVVDVADKIAPYHGSIICHVTEIELAELP